MFNRAVDWNKVITCGIFSGLLWGLFSLAFSSMTRLFQAESTLSHNLLTYLLGGAICGLVLAGIMLITEAHLPNLKTVWKGVVLSAGLWFLFFLTGVILHFTRPERYHLEYSQHLQGLTLSLLLGLILGLFWQKYGQLKRSLPAA